MATKLTEKPDELAPTMESKDGVSKGWMRRLAELTRGCANRDSLTMATSPEFDDEEDERDFY